jgi:hypothetical protein
MNKEACPIWMGFFSEKLNRILAKNGLWRTKAKKQSGKLYWNSLHQIWNRQKQGTIYLKS